MIKNKSQFTICIPTFNRGKRALEQVEFLLANIKKKWNWSILVLDNDSNKEIKYYNKIKKLSKVNKILTYIKHDKNCYFHGNYLASITMSKTKYIMIMSDEDRPNVKDLNKVLSKILNDNNIGIIRGSIKSMVPNWYANSIQHINNYYHAGKEALEHYAFSNNYLSGTIYNRNIILNYHLHKRLESNLGKHAIYPHLYLESLLCAISDIKMVSRILSFEGVNEQTIDESGMILGDVSVYKAPYTFGGRIDLMILLRDAVYEALGLIDKDIDMKLFFGLYFKIVEKTFFLISKVNSPLYISSKLNIKYLQESLLYCAYASILEYKEFKQIEDNIKEILNKIYIKYKISND